MNRLTNVIDRFANQTFYGFDGVGNLQAVRYANNVTNTYAYNALNRLTNITAKSSAGTIASFAYRLAPAGNRTNLVENISGTARTNVWQYDPLYRLTNEVITGASPTGTIGYKYDAVGNRTNRTSSVSGVATVNASFNSNDQLTTDSYDANGSTTNSAGNSYAYDVENRLTSATVGGTNIVVVYDGDGNRVKKIVGTTTNFFLVDDRNPTGYAQVLEELTAVGSTPGRLYTYGLDLISQRQSDGTTHFYGYDCNGNVRYLTAANGTVSDTYAYDAFGIQIASTGTTPNNYKFTGEQFDPNLGFYYLRARYSNPNTGRFWTRDSYAGNVFDPPSLHRYTYCANNPVNHIDPSGQEFLPTTLVSISIAVALTTFNVAVISQVTVNYHKFFGLSDKDRAAAIAQNERTMESLKRIINSNGERTFQDEQLGIGGTLGTKLPGNSAFQRAANLFESLRNIEGYPTALEELFTRLANRGVRPIPLPDDQTADQRAELAKALLHRQEAFDRWLRRNL